jgi:hypothetical protein
VAKQSIRPPRPPPHPGRPRLDHHPWVHGAHNARGQPRT